MSGATAATYLAAAAVAVAAAGTGYSIYSGEKHAKAQEAAQNEARAAAETQEKQADQAMNRANQKSPDVGAILSAAQQAAKGGGGGTMLTGPQGVDNSALQLGKSSLLGS